MTQFTGPKLAPFLESGKIWNAGLTPRQLAAECSEANREGSNRPVDTLWDISWTKGGIGGFKAMPGHSAAVERMVNVVRVLVPEFDRLREFPDNASLVTSIHLTNVLSDSVVPNQYYPEKPLMLGWTSLEAGGSKATLTTLIVAANQDELLTKPVVKFVVRTPHDRGTNPQRVNQARSIVKMVVMGREVDPYDVGTLGHAVYFLRKLKDNQIGAGSFRVPTALEEINKKCGTPDYLKTGNDTPPDDPSPPPRGGETNAKLIRHPRFKGRDAT